MLFLKGFPVDGNEPTAVGWNFQVPSYGTIGLDAVVSPQPISTYRSLNENSCGAVKVLAGADSLKTHVPIFSIDGGICKLGGREYSVHIPISWVTPSEDVVADWLPATDCDATVPAQRVRMLNYPGDGGAYTCTPSYQRRNVQ